MGEQPTEDTYTTELVSLIKEIGRDLGFDAIVQVKTVSGNKPDILLSYKQKNVAVIEVKRPEIPLSDTNLRTQALGYAEEYRKKDGLRYYGIHNLRYLSIYKYIGDKVAKTLDAYMPSGRHIQHWVSITDFPFKIVPWAKDIQDYKMVSNDVEARKNLSLFLLKFREILDGKILDISSEVICTIRQYIEDGASNGVGKLKFLYDNDPQIRNLILSWLKERTYQPKNDNELKKFLNLLLREQLYTFTIKILFYLVLQVKNTELAKKLQENLGNIVLKDPDLFKKIFDSLFQHAIEKTGDFEEVFGGNTVDAIPFVDPSISKLNELLIYLNQIRWGEIGIDIIGRVFEGLIYNERRHLLGQHYTNTLIVDLIIAATLRDTGSVLDPSCGSGTFLVRALNYWNSQRKRINEKIFEGVEGVDIDKLACMLSKVNLYIQSLEMLPDYQNYYPKIHHNDFFKVNMNNFNYVITNPPYTNQVELMLAFYDNNYKSNLLKTVEKIDNWSMQSSIYSYFLIKGMDSLKEDGRLGYIVENSWLNAEYGRPLKKILVNNFSLEMVIEPLNERLFEDAKIITNIIIAKKSGKQQDTRFIFLKKSLNELIGEVPPTNDLTANRIYYDKMSALLSKYKPITKDGYSIYDDEEVKAVNINKSTLNRIEDHFGRWGIFKGPISYLQLVLKFANQSQEGLAQMKDIFCLSRGLTTNANELFYLPSKYWEFEKESTDKLILTNLDVGRISIDKHNLKKLIRTESIQNHPYLMTQIPTTKKEDYVIWIEDEEKITDSGTKSYIEWLKNFVVTQNKMDERKYPTLKSKFNQSSWAKLPDTSNGTFIFRNDINLNYAFFFNEAKDVQIDKRLFFASLKNSSINKKIAFATLNSVLTYLGMELFGRTNLGEGALDVNVVDYNLIPILDPIFVQKELEKVGKMEKFLQYVDDLMMSTPVTIMEESKKESRIKMDELLLGTLGLENDVNKFYLELQKLAQSRALRAKNILK